MGIILCIAGCQRVYSATAVGGDGIPLVSNDDLIYIRAELSVLCSLKDPRSASALREDPYGFYNTADFRSKNVLFWLKKHFGTSSQIYDKVWRGYCELCKAKRIAEAYDKRNKTPKKWTDGDIDGTMRSLEDLYMFIPFITTNVERIVDRMAIASTKH
jgi:hypothetical protein